MLKPFELLENVLIEIEKGIRDDVDANTLAAMYKLSEGYLRRLFKFAFKQTISGYIRSRKLAASIDDLVKSDFNIIDIALEYGFDYEQSYIRSFKREFGLTPGDLRKSGEILKIKPPLNLFDENKLAEGLLFGPDIVMVPEFHLIGKKYIIPFSQSLVLAPKAAKDFWENEHDRITNTIDPNVYIGMTNNINIEKGHSDYFPSVQVNSLKNIPEGLTANTFETSLCARFRYIGQHHYNDLDRNTASEMYKAISKFDCNENAKYALSHSRTYFEKVDTSLYDGIYCQMEWFSPVVEKKKD